MAKTIDQLTAEEIDQMIATLGSDKRNFVRGLVQAAVAHPTIRAEELVLIQDILAIGSNAESMNYVGDSDYIENGLQLDKLSRYRPETREAVLACLDKCPDFCGLIRRHIEDYRTTQQAA